MSRETAAQKWARRLFHGDASPPSSESADLGNELEAARQRFRDTFKRACDRMGISHPPEDIYGPTSETSK